MRGGGPMRATNGLQTDSRDIVCALRARYLIRLQHNPGVRPQHPLPAWRREED